MVELPYVPVGAYMSNTAIRRDAGAGAGVCDFLEFAAGVGAPLGKSVIV